MSSCANTTKDVTFWKRKRYLVIFLSFLGFVNLFTMRANLSVAIVAMTEITNSTNEIGEEETHQHFDWDSKQRGFALSSFFYGKSISSTSKSYQKLNNFLHSQVIS